jgi:hypothetical protein
VASSASPADLESGASAGVTVEWELAKAKFLQAEVGLMLKLTNRWKSNE